MTISPVDFASLLCSRLCHDLLSPVGALNNGLELLADETDPAMRERCLELMNDSARTSANKLKFFRLAFGAAGGFGELVDSREAQTAIEGLLGDNKRLELHWLVEEPQLPKTAIKVLLNLGMIAGDALVRGGTLAIGGESHGEVTEIVLKAEGTRIVLDDELRRTLVDGADGREVTPRSAAAYLIHTLVAETGGSVQVSAPAENVLLFGATIRAG
ncbi:histidine phosphotransferase family protein [Sphingomonas sp. MMSM20]|uniref:histidine phosphotransferase family protein n=1 Tax=Sphingomonas lycopersici TaxID=2951807 RepID=UPI002237092E|nr:histidine phosphotransferase family protein [Sphingomonas lycopersici]MCW6529536.1 histidine phosphotransferase family protein [Sphingomonas lycopersici]